MRGNVVLSAYNRAIYISYSNTGNYIEKTCSQKYRLRGVRFITRLNTFACVWARGRTIACLS